MPWWHFAPGAAWLSALFTMLSFTNAGLAQCGLFKCIGVSVFSLYPDWMHVKHLGVDKVLLGSVLWILVHWILPGTDAEAKLNVIWSDIVRIYNEDNVASRYGSIKMTMFTSTSTPKLKGTASEIKHLAPVLVKIFEAYMDASVEMHRKILVLLRLSAHLDHLIDRNKDHVVMPASESEALIATGFAYCSLFYEISIAFKDSSVALFAITAKAHFLMHICLLSRYSRYR